MKCLAFILLLLPLACFGQGFSDASAPFLLSTSSLRKGLLAYWRLDEPSGTRYDSSQFGNHVVPAIGDVTNCNGLQYYAMASLKGASNCLVGTTNMLQLYPYTNWTTTGWYRIGITNATVHIFGRVNSSESVTEYGLLTLANGRFQFLLGNGKNTASGVNSPIVDQTVWHFIHAGLSNNIGFIQIDLGSRALTGTFTNGFAQPSTNLFYIFNDNGRYISLEGQADEIGIWNRLLSTNELTKLYNSGLSTHFPWSYKTGLAGNRPREAGWTWFSDSRAILFGGDTVFAGVDPIGNAIVSKGGTDYMLAKREVAEDDHDVPALMQRSDGTLMAFVNWHNITTNYWLLQSTTGTNWTTPVNIGNQIGGGTNTYSYSIPIELKGETNAIYLFTRAIPSGGNWAAYYTVSTDGGTNWTKEVMLFTGHQSPTPRPYVKCASDGTNRIDFLLTDGNPSEISTNSLFHCYYTGGNFYKSDGTLIRSLSSVSTNPIYVADSCTLIWNGKDYRAFNWDIVRNPTNGYPVVAYYVYQVSPFLGWYRAAFWNGSTWLDSQVCSVGGYLGNEKDYTGGIALDPLNPGTAIASVTTNTVNGTGPFTLNKYTFNGTGWDFVSQYSTSGSSIRPVFVTGATSGDRLAYMTGVYNGYDSYLTYLQAISP